MLFILLFALYMFTTLTIILGWRGKTKTERYNELKMRAYVSVAICGTRDYSCWKDDIKSELPVSVLARSRIASTVTGDRKLGKKAISISSGSMYMAFKKRKLRDARKVYPRVLGRVAAQVKYFITVRLKELLSAKKEAIEYDNQKER